MNLLLFLFQMTDDQMAAELDALGGQAIWVQLVPIVFWFVVATGIIALIMSLFNMLKDPKELVFFFIGAAVLATIFAIAWMLSSGEPPMGMDISPKLFKLIGGGLGTVLILMGLGFLFLIVDLVRGIFKV